MAVDNTTETTNSTETVPSQEAVSTDVQQDQDSSTSTTETKAVDDAKAAEQAALFGAPEADAAYQIEGLPEGMTIDQAALDAITPLARELNLSNAGMSKFAQVYATEVLPGVAKQVIDGVNADVAATQKAWTQEATALVQGTTLEDGTKVAPDAAFAGKTMKEVQSVAAKALDRFGGESFREFCEQTGMGNHPALLKFAFLAGSAISEDTSLERGGGQTTAPKSREEKYYPSKTTA